jgi:D-alanyl-D-alanine dipeptidase
MSELTNSPNNHELSQFIEAALYEPVPNMDELRERKKNYNQIPIDLTHELSNEQVVDIANYNIAGQAYYSRPNATTGEAITGVPKKLFLRKSIAETLTNLNLSLANPKITDFFGGEVELYLQDALRPVKLQKRLHDELIPALLRKNQPDISDEELNVRLKDIIALPSSDPNKPSPHATGGAFDVILRYKLPTQTYVEDSTVPLGHIDGDTSLRIRPDYFEQNSPETDNDKLAQRNRRAYYAILTGKVFGFDTGFVNNPTEWWHWGRGDQLSAKVQSANTAYYSLAETSDL